MIRINLLGLPKAKKRVIPAVTDFNAGKTPAVVDIDAFAVQNAYEYNYDPPADATVALLNLGASVMNINIVRGRMPLFTRDVSVGGNQYTDSLQKELDLGFEEAERLKMGGTVPGISDDAPLPVLKSVSEIIVLEIQKTFDFFRATAGGEHIQKLHIAGGSAKVYGLVGANGAGKTTLIKHLLGLLRAKSGSVRMFGLDPVRHPVEVLRQQRDRIIEQRIDALLAEGHQLGFAADELLDSFRRGQTAMDAGSNEEEKRDRKHG